MAKMTAQATVDADPTDKANREQPMSERSYKSLLGPWEWRTSESLMAGYREQAAEEADIEAWLAEWTALRDHLATSSKWPSMLPCKTE